MVKTQVQIPEALYHEAKRIAREREMSFAEVVRRGLEAVIPMYPPISAAEWKLPEPLAHGTGSGLSADQLTQILRDDAESRHLENLHE